MAETMTPRRRMDYLYRTEAYATLRNEAQRLCDEVTSLRLEVEAARGVVEAARAAWGHVGEPRSDDSLPWEMGDDVAVLNLRGALQRYEEIKRG